MHVSQLQKQVRPSAVQQPVPAGARHARAARISLKAKGAAYPITSMAVRMGVATSLEGCVEGSPPGRHMGGRSPGGLWSAQSFINRHSTCARTNAPRAQTHMRVRFCRDLHPLGHRTFGSDVCPDGDDIVITLQRARRAMKLKSTEGKRRCNVPLKTLWPDWQDPTLPELSSSSEDRLMVAAGAKASRWPASLATSLAKSARHPTSGPPATCPC